MVHVLPITTFGRAPLAFYRPNTFSADSGVTWNSSANTVDGTPASNGSFDATTSGSATRSTNATATFGYMSFSGQIVSSSAVLQMSVVCNDIEGMGDASIAYSLNNGTSYTEWNLNNFADGTAYLTTDSGLSISLASLTSNDLAQLRIRFSAFRSSVSNPMPPPASFAAPRNFTIYDVYVYG